MKRVGEFQFRDGKETFFTGLQVLPKRPEDYPTYASAVGRSLRTVEEIGNILSDSGRTPMRKRFPAEIWIGRQINNGCNGWAGAGALGRERVIVGHKPVVLSGDGLYAQISGGRDQGSALVNGMKAMEANGIPPQSMVKIGSYLPSHLSSEAKAAMKRFMGFECYRAETNAELADGLSDGFIGVVAVEYSDAYRRMDSSGLTNQSLGPGNHAVGVQDVRIVSGEFHFDSFNSHGRQFGQDGHNWLSWKRHLVSTIKYHAFYLIRAAKADPEADNPPIVKGSA